MTINLQIMGQRQGHNHGRCNAPGTPARGGPALLHFIVKYFC